MNTQRLRAKIGSIRAIEISIIVLTILLAIILVFMIVPTNSFGDSQLLRTLGFNSQVSSPYDFIKANQVEVYNDRIVIRIAGATMSSYAPTGSMDPVLDHTANGIEIPVTSKEQIHVGDIIAFELSPGSNELIVHRVIEIGYDNEGWYCITKGDNNTISDGKIRFEQIKFITVIIIY